MDGYSTMGWVALALFGLLSTFSAAAQEAITPINQARLQRLEDAGTPRAKAIEKLLAQSEVLASALLLLSTLANAGATAAVAVLAFYTYRADPVAVGALSLVLVTVLYFTQVLGRAVAGRDTRLTARLIEGPVSAVEVILSPFALVFARIAERILGGSLARERDSGVLNEEALYLMLGADDEDEDGNQSEQAMIHRIVELEDKTAHEIMTPRIHIAAVDAETPASELIGLAEEIGHSRIPVYKGSIDDVVGILHVKDLLPLVHQGKLSVKAGQIARPALFIPESKHVDELLHELQHGKAPMAIVVDEYGGTAGLVTIEDLLEEIVGEIRDEYDREEEERFRVLNEREAVVAAAVSVDEVNRTLGLDLQTDGFDTLGGLVYHELGKMPETGDFFELDGLRVTVLSIEGRRIERVKLEQLEPSGDEEPSGEETRRAWRRSDSMVRS